MTNFQVRCIIAKQPCLSSLEGQLLYMWKTRFKKLIIAFCSFWSCSRCKFMDKVQESVRVRETERERTEKGCVHTSLLPQAQVSSVGHTSKWTLKQNGPCGIP